MKLNPTKSKRLSSEDGLENEFYSAQRTKKNPFIGADENMNTSNDGSRLAKVPHLGISKKGILSDTSFMSLNITKDSENSKSNETKLDKLMLADVLDCKFTPSHISYRDKEMKDILSFIGECLNSKKNDSLFITGNPGTGKTLTLNYVLKGLVESGTNFLTEKLQEKKFESLHKHEYEFNLFNFNAMSYKNPVEFYGDLLEALTNKKNNEKCTEYNFGTVYDKVKDILCSSSKINLVFIDEIDNLFTKQNSTEIFELFKLPRYSKSSLIIFGASNTIDLIIKLNQQYKLSIDMKNIVFQPYNFDEILNIIKGRLNENKFGTGIAQFDEFGLKYCAKKILTLKGGDVRCALDIVKKVYVEKVTSDSVKSATESKIVMEDMVKVFEQFYGKKILDIVNTMPQNQKLGLIGLYRLLKRSTVGPLTKADFLGACNKVADEVHFTRMSSSDLEEILQAYTTYQFVNIKSTKKTLAPSKMSSALKNKNEELVPLIQADQIKESLEEDEFYSTFF